MMHYEISGQGEPLVFIHGFGGSSRWWGAQKKFFEKDYHVMTVDLPGHGQSPWGRGTLMEMAADVQEILQVFAGQKVNVIASSLGGMVAWQLYRRAPEQITRMSFVGSIPKFARSPHYPAGLDIDKIRTLSGQFDGDYASILDIFFRSLFTMKERDSQRFKWIKELRAQEPLPRREALKAFLDILEKADLRDRLSAVICPVQFVTGVEDYICPRPIMDWVAEHAYNARFDFLAGCGHLPFLTEVTEYNRLLEDFLLS